MPKIDVLNEYRELLTFVNSPNEIQCVHFAGSHPKPPESAYHVDFSRLEVVIEGELSVEIGSNRGDSKELLLKENHALFLPDLSWNYPKWDKHVIVANILFGKKNTGFSIVEWTGTELILLKKVNFTRVGPRTGSYILKALNEASHHPDDQPTSRLLIAALIAYSLELSSYQEVTDVPHSKLLLESIKSYIFNHYHLPLTRDSVANEFNISANYLSQVFHMEGDMLFNEFLTKRRIEVAKKLLSRPDLKIKEVAEQCGFIDSNYFCRIFKKQTSLSPTQYRSDYQSKNLQSENL